MLLHCLKCRKNTESKKSKRCRDKKPKNKDLIQMCSV